MSLIINKLKNKLLFDIDIVKYQRIFTSTNNVKDIMKTQNIFVTAEALKSNSVYIERGETVYIINNGIERIIGFFERFDKKGRVVLIGGTSLDSQDALIENIVTI